MYLKSSLPICILKLKPEIATESWAALHTGPAAIRGHSLRWQLRGAPRRGARRRRRVVGPSRRSLKLSDACGRRRDAMPARLIGNGLRELDLFLTDLIVEADRLDRLGVAAGVDRLGLPGWRWLTEVNTDVGKECLAPGKCPTVFVGPLGIAASFNRSMWEAVGDAEAGEESATAATDNGASASLAAVAPSPPP